LNMLLSADTLRGRASIDSMLKLVERQDELYLKGLDEARSSKLPEAGAEAVIFYGLGGSGIVGHISSAIFQDVSTTPLLTFNTSTIPNWIRGGMLVVLLSYSGETLEVLRAARSLTTRGVRAVVICSGGRLEGVARDANIPLVKVTAGLAPRMAVPEMVGAVAGVLDAVGAARGAGGVLERSVRSLSEARNNYSPDVDLPENAAKRASLFLRNRLPHAVAGSSLYPAALRLKNQLNENAKKQCILIDIPEAMHNTLEALPTTPRDGYIIYRWGGYDVAIAVQLDFLARLLGGRVLEVQFGSTLAEAMLSAIMWSDFVSLYTAALLNVDPLPVSKISAVRRELEKLKI